MELQTLNYYLELTSLVILALCAIFVLIILRFRLDLAGYVILSLYLLGMILRVIPNEVARQYPVLIVIWPIASILIWAILFYFVF